MKLGPAYQDGDNIWQDVLEAEEGDLKPEVYECKGTHCWYGGWCVPGLPFEDGCEYRIPATSPIPIVEPSIPLSAVVSLLEDNYQSTAEGSHLLVVINHNLVCGRCPAELRYAITKELTRLFLEGK